MTFDISGIREDFLRLTGLRAWGLSRTHGSMFFLEVGKPLDRPRQVRRHGEWNFLVEMTEWRFETSESLLIGSDDSPELIDERFSAMKLGAVDNGDVILPTLDLILTFSSGVRLRTFGASALYAEEKRKQWMFFRPDDNVWAVSALGKCELKSRYT